MPTSRIHEDGYGFFHQEIFLNRLVKWHQWHWGASNDCFDLHRTHRWRGDPASGGGSVRWGSIRLWKYQGKRHQSNIKYPNNTHENTQEIARIRWIPITHTQKVHPTNKQAKTKQLATLEKSCIFLFLLDTTKKEIKQNVVTVFCYFCWTVTFPEMIAWQYGSAVSSSSVSVISSWWASTLSLMDSKLEPLTPVSWLRLRPRQHEQAI